MALPWAGSWVTSSAGFVPGITMEMAGTLMGAAVHGLIVSGAHGSHKCDDIALPDPVAITPKAVSAYAAWPARTRSVESPLSSRATSSPGLSMVVWGLSSAHHASHSFPYPLVGPMTRRPTARPASPPRCLLNKYAADQQAIWTGGGRPRRTGGGRGEGSRVWCPCRAQGRAPPVTSPSGPQTEGP